MENKTTHIKRKIAIVTCCCDDWGGSEELWARSLPNLQAAGYGISLYKLSINRKHPKLAELAASGVRLEQLAQSIFPYHPGLNFTVLKMVQSFKRVTVNRHLPHLRTEEEVFLRKLRLEKPDLVIVAQGINFDGLGYAHCCRLLQIPYVIIFQKAVDFFWPEPFHRSVMLASLQQAKQCFFVSQHNLRLTEEQFGTRLPNAKVVYNPVKLVRKPVPYPSSDHGFRLACVARLFIIDKGQDILLRILNQDKWRNRPISITLVGSGKDEVGLKAMAGLLDLKNITFGGYHNDIEQLYNGYHGFILPSRSEGLPLSMIEAMAAGRVVIVSKAGGNAEVVEEGVTGFMGQADEESFEQAMEKAWERRHDWKAIGLQASKYVAQHIPLSPENDFAEYIKQVDHE